MKVERIGEPLAVLIPADVAATLGLQEGDAVEMRAATADRAAAIEVIRQLARPLPSGYRFDREEANAR